MIGKTCIHAIRALVELARLPDGRSLGAAQLALEIHAPPNYLGKLLRTLAREGLVEPRKGPGGGFRLARRPDEVCLLDVVEPIEPTRRWKQCVLGQPECSDENPCAVHPRWKCMREDYLKMLSETTIADLT